MQIFFSLFIHLFIVNTVSQDIRFIECKFRCAMRRMDDGDDEEEKEMELWE